MHVQTRAFSSPNELAVLTKMENARKDAFSKPSVHTKSFMLTETLGLAEE
jgi:hypothetical protein